MNNFARLREANRHFSLFDLSSSRLRKYGRSADYLDFREAVAYMRTNSKIPEQGHDYRTSFAPLEDMKLKEEASRLCYGHMNIQVGYCNGKNVMLDGLEYHKGTEICVAVTDTVLFLGSLVDMDGITFDSKNVEALYLAEGEALEMFPTTLHFCPCHTTKASPGFKTIVLLPEGTNCEVEGMKALPSGEGRLLWRRNEWQMVHAEYRKGVADGNHPGLIGENYRLNVV
jgi:hypothetical protein